MRQSAKQRLNLSIQVPSATPSPYSSLSGPGDFTILALRSSSTSQWRTSRPPSSSYQSSGSTPWQDFTSSRFPYANSSPSPFTRESVFHKQIFLGLSHELIRCSEIFPSVTSWTALAVLSGVRCLGVWFSSGELSRLWTLALIAFSWLIPNTLLAALTYANWARRGHARKDSPCILIMLNC